MAGGPMAARLVLVLVLGRWGGPVGPQRAGAGAGGLLRQRVLASEPAGLPEGVLVGHTCKDRQGRVSGCHPRSGAGKLPASSGAQRGPHVAEGTAMGTPARPEAQGTRGHLLESVLRLALRTLTLEPAPRPCPPPNTGHNGGTGGPSLSHPRHWRQPRWTHAPLGTAPRPERVPLAFRA